MASAGSELLETLLRQCQATAPEPLYAGAYAQTSGLPREQIDAALDQLRLAGLIRLTDWAQGRGQGYTLTPAGTEALQNLKFLQRLRHKGATPLPVEKPLP